MEDRVVVCAPSWLGDGVMAMPALQDFRRRNPDANLTVLGKAAVLPLWELHGAPDRLVRLGTGLAGTAATVRALRRIAPDRAYVLPHSIRGALVPFLAGVPARIGKAGHATRDWLLTQVADVGAARERHQAYEYLALMSGPEAAAACEALEPPKLEPSDELRAAAERRLAGVSRPRVGLFPFAARPSKRWPAPRFAELGRALVRDGLGVILLGSPAEAPLGRKLAAGIGDGVMDLGGRTTLGELAAILELCDAVVANDSGGMHLAAAAGTPVVAIFGGTDPSKTGPLGSGVRIIRGDLPPGSGAGAAGDALARARLAEVGVERVWAALHDLLSREIR